MRSSLEEPSSHRTRGEGGGSPANHPSLSEAELPGVARTGLHGLLIHGEVSPSPLGSRLRAGALRRRAELEGSCPSARREGEKNLFSPALPTRNLAGEQQHTLSAGGCLPLRSSGSWISASKMLLAPAFPVPGVMPRCLPLLRAPRCPPRPWSGSVFSGCMGY